MKNNKMKSKLLAATLSLAMSFILLTSASFAWFTVSQAPEVESFDVTMSATRNLEIAMASTETATPGEVTANDAGNEEAWGAVITTATGANIEFPAMISGSNFGTVKYDKYGRTDGMFSDVSHSDMAGGIQAITSDIVYSSGGDYYILTSDANIGAVYGFWIRSNTTVSDLHVTIGTTSNFAAKYTAGAASGSNVVWASGSSLKDAVKVAIATSSNLGSLIGASTGMGTIDLGGKLDLVPNVPNLVRVVVFVDGAACTAETVSAPFKIEGLSLQFTSDTVSTTDSNFNKYNGFPGNIS